MSSLPKQVVRPPGHLLLCPQPHADLVRRRPRQIYETRDRFIFNTHHLYLVGSPLGLFLHLRQAQLVPRRGRERTKNSPADEALDRAGRFGCLAVDTLANIFHPSDPIAYMLNPTVDAAHARKMEPLQISNVTAGLLASVADSVKTGVGSLSKVLGVLPNVRSGVFPAALPSRASQPLTLSLPSQPLPPLATRSPSDPARARRSGPRRSACRAASSCRARWGPSVCAGPRPSGASLRSTRTATSVRFRSLPLS